MASPDLLPGDDPPRRLPPFDLEAARAAVPPSPQASDLAPWRVRIDEIDREVVRLLNERLACAHEIGAIKKRLDMPVYVPSREQDVIDNVVGANRGPLADASVRRLFERVIDETRSSERHQYDNGSDTDSSPS
jgi:chorismate mutase